MNGKGTALFSKASDEWSTPQDLFDLLDAEFHFGLDAAATAENSKCGSSYCDKIGDALELVNWNYHAQGKPIWLNPPYSLIGKFMAKAAHEAYHKGATVVCLIPSRTDTRYWHDYVMHAHELRFIRGRLKFGGANNGAPFPSCIVIFRPMGDLMDQLANLGGPANVRSMEQPRKRSVSA